MSKIGERSDSPAISQYETSRDVAQNSELAKYAAELEGETPEVESVNDKEMERRSSDFMKHISEIPPAIGRGMLRSVQEMGNFAIDVADWAEDNLAEAGYGDGKFITEESQLTFGDRSFDAPETLTGNIVQGVSQFVVPFTAFSKAIKVGQGAVGAAKLARAAGIGAAVDFTSFDPKEERLSNFLNTFPSLKTPVSEYLASNPKDTKAEGRFKNAIEGLGLGVATDFVFAGLSRALKFYRGRRVANNVKTDNTEVLKQIDEINNKVDYNVKDEIDTFLNENSLSNQLDMDSTEFSGTFNSVHKSSQDLDQFIPTDAVPDEIRYDGGNGVFGKQTYVSDTQYWKDLIHGNKSYGVETTFKKAYVITPKNLPKVLKDIGAEALDNPRQLPDLLKEKGYDGLIVKGFEGAEKLVDNLKETKGTFEEQMEVGKEVAEALDLSEFNLGVLQDQVVSFFPDRDLNIKKKYEYQKGKGVMTEAKEGEPKLPLTPDQELFRTPPDIIEGVKRELKENRWTQQEPPPIPKFEDVVVGEGERAVNINLDKIESTDDVAKVLKSMSEQFADEIDEARRGVVTDEQREILAENLGMSVKDVMDLERGQALNAEQLIASNRLLSVSASTVFDLAKKIKEGDDSTAMKALMLEAFDKHRIIQAKVSGAIAEAGRALRAMKADIPLDKAAKNRYLKELIDQGGGEKGLADLVDLINNMGDSTKDLSVVARKSMNRGLAKAIKEAWVNSWLSGVKTQVINASTNAFTMVTRPVERRLGAALSKGGPDSVAKGEMMAMYQGLINGTLDAFRMAGRTWDTGESAFRGSQKFIIEKTPVAGAMSYENAISSATFNVDASSTYGRFLDFIGKAINVPTRALESSDEFFKAMNYRSELHAQAYRKAYRNKLDLGLSEAEFQAQFKNFIENPDETIQLKSLEAARESTFTKPLDEVKLRGFEAETLDNFIKRTPILKIVTPFTKTNLNLVEYALNRTPFAKGLAEDIAAGGARRDVALGRVAFGSSVMTLGAGLAVNGIITGKGPADRRAKKALQATGWRPYSVKINNKYYPYDRFEPFGSLLGISADYAEIAGAWNREEEELTALALQSAVTTAHFFTPEFVTRNLFDFADVLRGDEYKTQQFIAGLTRATVPFSSTLSDVTKITDPVMRSKRPDKNSAFSMWDRMVREVKSVTPGLSDDLPPRRNVFGEAVMYYSLSQTSEDIDPFQEAGKNDAISKFIRTLNETADDIFTDDEEYEMFKIDMPSQRIQYKGSVYNLTPEQYDRYVQLSAGLESGIPLREALNEEIESGFPSLGSEAKSMKGMIMALREIISDYRKAAKRQLFEEDVELEDAVLENRERYQDKLETEVDLDLEI